MRRGHARRKPAATLRAGPVVVPFGAAWHDWAALELGAWVARATGRAAAADRRRLRRRAPDGRDASRLLADASLIVQRSAGVVAEPLLASPGRKGVIALAEGAGLLVVGLSERWRQEGLGRVRSELVEAPPAPTVLVRQRAAAGRARAAGDAHPLRLVADGGRAVSAAHRPRLDVRAATAWSR